MSSNDFVTRQLGKVTGYKKQFFPMAGEWYSAQRFVGISPPDNFMKLLLKTYKEEQKKKVNFSRVLTNRATIIGWRMFQKDRTIHMGFILYRLKRDFGFTDWEIANFTGIPKRDIHNFMRRIKPILDSEVLQQLATMDWIEEEKGWRSIPDGHGRAWQGYYVPKHIAWYDKGKYRKHREEPLEKLGVKMKKDGAQ